MRKVLILLIFLYPITLFAPFMYDIKEQIYAEYMYDSYVIQNNLKILKDATIKTRNEVFHLVEPILDIYLTRFNYKKNFPNMDSVSYALACIFVSESSNRKGQAAKSSLWLSYNNPFGITGKTGKSLKSWEMINNKKVIMHRTFREYTSFEDAVHSLMNDCLLKERYNSTANSFNVKTFLQNLYADGYMTNKHWPHFAYNQIYLKCLKEK